MGSERECRCAGGDNPNVKCFVKIDFGEFKSELGFSFLLRGGNERTIMEGNDLSAGKVLRDQWDLGCPWICGNQHTH